MASPVSEIQRPHDVPEKIGKYVIINKIGKGSTGMVYLSHDPYYRRDVAIKVYNIEEDADADRAQVSRKMFFNEAHMVGMLQHPNIMPIYDAGEEDGKYYVVTEHIQGARTLAAYCRPDNLLRFDDVLSEPSSGDAIGADAHVALAREAADQGAWSVGRCVSV